MQPSLPLWFQRLPDDRRRGVELAVAAATEARLDTHAEQALNLVAVLGHRLPFDEAVDRYIEIMDLSGEDASTIRTRALAALGDAGILEKLQEPPEPAGRRTGWRYATPLGAVRFVRRQLRRNAEEDLWMELSAARAEEALVRTHVRHAIPFIEYLEEHLPPTRALALYLEQLEIPAMRARSVYQRTLARIAMAQLPRLAHAPTPPPATLREPLQGREAAEAARARTVPAAPAPGDDRPLPGDSNHNRSTPDLR